MPRDIFISYRRDDDPGMALALYGHLEKAFSEQRIFMDVEDGIPPGHDFVQVLEERVAQCHVMLALIGEHWIEARDRDGRQRLDNPNDFVRIEIESAMRLGKLVIPVLINKTEMPRADELPDSMKAFVRRQAIHITAQRLRADALGVVQKIERGLAEIQRQDKEAEVPQRGEAKLQADEAQSKGHAKPAEALATAEHHETIDLKFPRPERQNWEAIPATLRS